MPNQLLAFTLDTQRYALRLAGVRRVVPMVEVTPLPSAPEIVIGVVNVQGRIMPVLNIRRRFSLRERGAELSDQLIIVETRSRSVAVVVDFVIGIVERSPEEIADPEKIVPRTQHLEGIAKLEDGILLIHDLDRFLSLDEENQLETLLTAT
jgi:purine-binding chemotaxis protein CheW